MKFKAVIFDLDGTLLDTLADIADSMNRVLVRHGFQDHGYDAYRFFIGDGLVNLVQRALPPENRNPELADECLAEMKQDYRRNWKNKTKPYPGILDMLRELNKTGLPLAVLSNKDHVFTLEMVDWFFPQIVFAEVAGAKPDVPLKPNPEAARAILSTLALEPKDALFVGDTSVDIKTAVNAGMYPLGVSWGFRPVQEILEAGAKRIIDKPEELTALFSNPWANKTV